MNVTTSKSAGAVALSLLLLALLGGCVEPRYLVTSASDDRAVLSGKSDGPRSPVLAHTRQPVIAAHAEIVPLRIDPRFSLHDRTRILQAIGEWNLVLNGFVRFDIVPPPTNGARATPIARSWLVVASPGFEVPRGPNGQVLAITLGQPGSGGMVVVYVDRLAGRDLVGVMRHELGHVLGLDHDPRGGLMATHYSPHDQQCVDRAAAEAIARLRKLALDQLNWCES